MQPLTTPSRNFDPMFDGVVIHNNKEYPLLKKSWRAVRGETPNGVVQTQVNRMYAKLIFYSDDIVDIAVAAADSDRRIDVTVKEWDPTQVGRAIRTTQFNDCKVIFYGEALDDSKKKPACIELGLSPYEIRVNDQAVFKRG